MVNWNNAPEGAQFHANDVFWKFVGADNDAMFYNQDWWKTTLAGVTPTSLTQYDDFQVRPVAVLQKAVEKEAERLQHEVMTAVAVTSHLHLYSADDVPRNKYDREIIGKYGTGKCTVDVYRVLNAFGPLSPEIQHAIKKLLAPGKRGVKDEKQDLLEAIQSIEARLQYMDACDD